MAPDSISAGEELVKQDLITREDLDRAQAYEQETGIPWYKQLLQKRMVSFETIEDVLRYEFHPKARRSENQQLGQNLLELGEVTQVQLEVALAEQKRTGRLLGTILLEQGFVTREAIGRALSRQYGMEYANLVTTPSDRYALEMVPESVARKNLLLPVELEGDRLTVLVANPQVCQKLEDVAVLLGKRIHPVLTATEDIRIAIEARYRSLREGTEDIGITSVHRTTGRKALYLANATSKPEATSATHDPASAHVDGAHKDSVMAVEEPSRFEDIAREASGAPVIKLVTTIIEGAVNSGATDVHLDPQEPEMRVRYRIDGVLHDVLSIPAAIEAAVVSRVKIMADLDITETRHPQDGHISLEIGEAEFDVRVATLPTFSGERVVLRLLDQSSILSGIRDLGLDTADEKRMTEIIEQAYGMILVTGPTGSGKTTTLYAALNQKNVLTESIVTIEDPVEYQLSGINQVQVDPDIDLTFASTLRAALRQDIDVLLVGEIRDAETAHIAIRAAMTGHLVFSTLHTNDALEAITTLSNMGIPQYLISSALTAVVAQRLVRKICPNCKKGFKPSAALLKSLGLPGTVTKLYRGAGCEVCYQTGNRGRTGIFEILEITPELRKLIAEGSARETIIKASKMKNMAIRTREKVKAGIIEPEEYLRIIRE
jgi:type IV pilus assembly protein PilB